MDLDEYLQTMKEGAMALFAVTERFDLERGCACAVTTIEPEKKT